MKKMTWLLLFICVLFVAGLIFFGWRVPIKKHSTVTIKSQTFQVDVANTALTRTQGLSGRDPLGPDQGMLFLFGKPGNQHFWMKDMKFAIDIVWISNNQIAGIEKNAPPPTPGQTWFSLKIYNSPGEVDKVLELPAGTADKYGFTPEDAVAYGDVSGM